MECDSAVSLHPNSTPEGSIETTSTDESSVLSDRGQGIPSEVSEIVTQIPSREVLEYEKDCRPQLVQLSKDLPVIHKGDHLQWLQKGAWRQRIVTVVPEITEGEKLFHLTFVRYSYNFPRFSVRKEVIAINLNKDKLYRYEYDQFCHPPDLVIERARKCIGQTSYNSLRNNNEDFCRWCKAGKHTYTLHNETTLVPASSICQAAVANDKFYTCVANLREIRPGHHIYWCAVEFDDEGAEECGNQWKHGIVLNVTNEEVYCSGGDKSISFGNDSILRYKFRRALYPRSHDDSIVLDRAGYHPSDNQTQESSSAGFACWAKTGVPESSQFTETTFRVSAEGNREESSTSKKSKGMHAGRSAATVVTRIAEGAAARAFAKQTSKVVLRGAAEGAAAAAAVGVEAAFLAADIILTYKSFSKKKISKNELQKNNIVNTTRSVGAAGASIGLGVAGAAIGSFLGPVGAVVGGLVGGIVGGVSGQFGGSWAGKGIAFASRRPYDDVCVDPEDMDLIQGCE